MARFPPRHAFVRAEDWGVATRFDLFPTLGIALAHSIRSDLSAERGGAISSWSARDFEAMKSPRSRAFFMN